MQADIKASVVPRRNNPAIRIRLLYSSIITVKLQTKIGNNTAYIPECSRIVSRPTPFYKKFELLAVLFVTTVCLSFVFNSFRVMTNYGTECLQNIGSGQ